MAVNTRIYASGAIAFGGDPAIDDLIAVAYSAVVVWSVHVRPNGNLVLNDTQIVSDGVYKEVEPLDLPVRLAKLRSAGSQVIFSVGSADNNDFAHIGGLLGGSVPGPGNVLYDNFDALKKAMVAVGGDIDAIDFDNEDEDISNQADIMVNFGSMLAAIGYSSVTLCPFSTAPVWTDTYTQLLARHGKDFVSAIHMQCYAGGAGASPGPWGKIIADSGGDTLLIPGLATNQTVDGKWWNTVSKKPGGSVVMTPNVAMSASADWSGLVYQGNFASADEALQYINPKGGETFFFYCREAVTLGSRQFQAGDAVFFAAEPTWTDTSETDGYSLSGGCSNTYNANGACPSDLQATYADWTTEAHPPDGGFIWLYDSVVSCLLSRCCGGTEAAPATTALDYKTAIIQGLSRLR